MLFVSDYDIIMEPTRSIIIIIQSCLCIGGIIIGFLTLVSMKKRGEDKGRKYYFGIPMFFFLYSITRGILIYHDYFAIDELDLFLWALANLVMLSAFLILNHMIETTIYKKSKHFFTITGLALTTFYIIFVLLNKLVATIIFYVDFAILIIPPMFIYFVVAKGGKGEVKKKALIIMIGFLLQIIASLTGVFETFGIMDRITGSMFGPPVALIGLILCGYGFTMND